MEVVREVQLVAEVVQEAEEGVHLVEDEEAPEEAVGEVLEEALKLS